MQGFPAVHGKKGRNPAVPEKGKRKNMVLKEKESVCLDIGGGRKGGAAPKKGASGRTDERSFARHAIMRHAAERRRHARGRERDGVSPRKGG